VPPRWKSGRRNELLRCNPRNELLQRLIYLTVPPRPTRDEIHNAVLIDCQKELPLSELTHREELSAIERGKIYKSFFFPKSQVRVELEGLSHTVDTKTFNDHPNSTELSKEFLCRVMPRELRQRILPTREIYLTTRHPASTPENIFYFF
jgi:hypothetical protein